MSTRFHPICSSWFVSDDWINLLFDPDISYFFQLDFRSSATGQFQMLSSLCSFVKQSVRDSIDDFLSDTFFSPQLVTQQLMDAQVQSETLFLRTSTVNSVRQVLSFIRSATHNNQLQSALQTSKSLSIIVRSDGTAVINAMISLTDRFRTVYSLIKTKLIHLNLFENHETQNDQVALNTSILSTRIFILILGVSIMILIGYTSSIVQTQTHIINNPSRAIYEDLYTKYSIMLQCECSEIAIPYGSFLSLSPEYHPVCSSAFITDTWLQVTRRDDNLGFAYDPEDFFYAGFGFFNTLASLCSLAQTILNNSLHVFNRNRLVSGQVLFKDELIPRSLVILDTFKTNTINKLKRDLSLIQSHTRGMLSISQGITYTRIYEEVNRDMYNELFSVPLEWDDCSCALNDQCKALMGFYWNNGPPLLKFTIPNLFVGCFTLQAVYQSSLDCLFNQTCLNAAQNEIRSERPINVSVL
ncbi:unnamed protein product [Rotaria sp. Silwood2]|nr:unnamed protein product [Rotaria sp. Silwood2]